MLRRTLLQSTAAAAFLGFAGTAAAATTLRVGVTAGLHAEILEKVVPFAIERGLNCNARI